MLESVFAVDPHASPGSRRTLALRMTVNFQRSFNAQRAALPALHALEALAARATSA